MNALQILRAGSKKFYLFLGILSLISSFTNFGILLMINTALQGNAVASFGKYNYILFLGLILLSFLTNSYFQNRMTELASNIIFDMEISIIQKVRSASFESFQQFGRERVYTAIGDVQTLGGAPSMLVNLFNSLISIICALGYIFWISWLGGTFVIGLITALLLFYLYRNKSVERDLNKLRDAQVTYHFYLYELMHGFKQLKISAKRNNELFRNHLLANRKISTALRIKSSKKSISNQLFGSYSWFLVLGVIVFVLPAFFTFNIGQIAAFITAVLFIMGPVSMLINIIPFYTQFKISLQRINEIEKVLEIDSYTANETEIPVRDFSVVRFEDIVYTYNNKDKESFTINLPDFTVSREEILFIVGGNGSGKTTFINVLTGLCKPESGRIFIDEKEVDWMEYCHFANSMAVVYTDQHLFGRNYDQHDFSTNNPQVKYLADLLNLNDNTLFNREKKEIDTRLSKGQQKRLLLLLALLENKPVIILDEWAAEQDPYNRNCFYTKWLNAMKDMGKTIIAISHDDDFYHHADRVVKFDLGKITSEVLHAQ